MLPALLLLPSLLIAFAPFQEVDPTLTPTAGGVAVATAAGRGVQIYGCSAGTDGSYSWAFKNPEAALTEPSSGKLLGTHGKGPTWTWNDGSAITGTVLAKTPSPEVHSIPWLLLKTQSVGAAKGKLSEVGLVRRSETRGGEAPSTGCDARHVNSTLRVPYSATYTFYTVAVSPQKP